MIVVAVLQGFMGCIGYKIMKGAIEVATGGSFYECAAIYQIVPPELSLFNITSNHAPLLNASDALVNGSGSWELFETTTREYECSLSDVEPTKISFLEKDCGASRMLFTWEYGWKFILPAIPIGVPMYLLKRNHIGKPRDWMPAFIILPNLAFYLVLGSTGYLDGIEPADSLRSCGKTTDACPGGSYNWFFAAVNDHDYQAGWEQWDGDKVNWDAIQATLPVMVLMILIVDIDAMLKLAGTEKQLGIGLDMNSEMAVASLSSFVNACFFGPPGYGQTKFSVLNFAITRDTANRFPGIVCAVFNAVMYFSGFPLLNYLPRFFLSGLLIFAGAGFAVENLWDARLSLPISEFTTIWIIVIANVFWGLLPAMFVGIMLSSVIFATKASQTNVIKFTVTRKAFQSKVQRSPWVEWKLGNLGDQIWIMKLQGFIFFGTVSRLVAKISGLMELRAEWVPDGENTLQVEAAHQMQTLILDFESVSGLDSTGMFAFTKLQRIAKENGVKLLFSDLQPRLMRVMVHQNKIISQSHYMNTLNEAVEYAEECVLKWAADVRSNWYRVPEVRRVYNFSMMAMAVDAMAMRDLFPRNTVSLSDLMSYCTKLKLQAGNVLLKEGEMNDSLFIVVTGRLRAYSSQGTDDIKARHVATVSNGTFINQPGFCLSQLVTETYQVEEDAYLLAVSKSSFNRMMTAHPSIALALQSAVIASILALKERLQLEMRAVMNREQDEIEEELSQMSAADLFSLDGVKSALQVAYDVAAEAAELAVTLASTVAHVAHLDDNKTPKSPRSPRSPRGMDNPLSSL